MMRYRLHAAWHQSEEHAKFKEWAGTVDGIRIPLAGGHSWIDGVLYNMYIDFEDSETYMLFKLMFPKLNTTFFEILPRNRESNITF